MGNYLHQRVYQNAFCCTVTQKLMTTQNHGTCSSLEEGGSFHAYSWAFHQWDKPLRLGLGCKMYKQSQRQKQVNVCPNTKNMPLCVRYTHCKFEPRSTLNTNKLFQGINFHEQKPTLWDTTTVISHSELWFTKTDILEIFVGLKVLLNSNSCSVTTNYCDYPADTAKHYWYYEVEIYEQIWGFSPLWWHTVLVRNVTQYF